MVWFWGPNSILVLYLDPLGHCNIGGSWRPVALLVSFFGRIHVELQHMVAADHMLQEKPEDAATRLGHTDPPPRQPRPSTARWGASAEKSHTGYLAMSRNGRAYSLVSAFFGNSRVVIPLVYRRKYWGAIGLEVCKRVLGCIRLRPLMYRLRGAMHSPVPCCHGRCQEETSPTSARNVGSSDLLGFSRIATFLGLVWRSYPSSVPVWGSYTSFGLV